MEASETHSTVSGGVGNRAIGNKSSIGGGFFNVTNGRYSMIPGGFENHAKGAVSFAGGYQPMRRVGARLFGRIVPAPTKWTRWSRRAQTSSSPAHQAASSSTQAPHLT